MSSEMSDNFIIDEALSDECDFSVQKSIGLKYIKALTDSSWSNFNESDPGVTILEQLCYALTELGYCNEFSIEDILTRSDNRIHFENQFFKPEDILTCSAVTLEDQCKLVMDKLNGIAGIYIYPMVSSKGLMTGCYDVFLSFEERLTHQDKSILLNRVFETLNSNRQIGEMISKVKSLSIKEILLQGSISINSNTSAREVLDDLSSKLHSYVSPVIKKSSYGALKSRYLDSGAIFNGPKLSKGWMPELSGECEKRSTVKIMDIIAIISQLEGVEKIHALSFLAPNEPLKDEGLVAIAQDQVAQIGISLEDFDFYKSGVKEDISLNSSAESYLSKMNGADSVDSSSSSISPDLPKGVFRDIGDYYSIQNTFPENYAVGENALPDSASNFRVAQSRQLKGFLSLFDQMLINQFSQLDGTSYLLSFGLQSNESQTIEFSPQVQTAPPSYFFKPIYDLPNIKPLLLGHDAFDFDLKSKSEAESQSLAWLNFKSDSYNQYLSGLRKCIEDETERESRRNSILDHLLARHGENGSEIEEMILDTRSFLSTTQTKIIIKSLYLQNLGLLSYNRGKGFNFLNAKALIFPGRYRLANSNLSLLAQLGVPAEDIKEFIPISKLGFSNVEYLKEQLESIIEMLNLKVDKTKFISSIEVIDCNSRAYEMAELFVDGVIDLKRLEEREKLIQEDIESYSTFELFSNLFLGLTHHYGLIVDILLNVLSDSKFSSWVINERVLESKFSSIVNGLNVLVKCMSDGDHVYLSGEDIITIERGDAGILTLIDYQRHIDQLIWLSESRKGFIFVEAMLLLKSSCMTSGELKKLGLAVDNFYLNSMSVFPEYVALIRTKKFQNSLDHICSRCIPMHVNHRSYFYDRETISNITSDFVAWHNANNLKSSTKIDGSKHAKSLINLIVKTPSESSASDVK